MTASAPIQQLRAHAARLSATPIDALCAADPARASALALRVGPLYANFARQRYDAAALAALFALADQADLPGRSSVRLTTSPSNNARNRPGRSAWSASANSAANAAAS